MEGYFKYRMELLSSEKIKEYLKKKDLVILPTGSVEMHGPDIPVGCDIFITWATSILFAEKWQCLVAPPIIYTYPGASDFWSGTIDVSVEITFNYIKEVTKGFLKNGFNKVIIMVFHGPLIPIVQMVVREIFRETGKIVLSFTPNIMPDEKMVQKLGYKEGEDIWILASLKILGLPLYKIRKYPEEKPISYPFETQGKLRKYGCSFPLIFSRNYQHTGLRNCVKEEDIDKVIEVMREVVNEMPDLPEIYEKYIKQMEKLIKRERPWEK
ncbi:MAG: creatininase family protein [bacterium]|nr:creatininase family protein [bacterium]MDW8164166.1 creatininase family protein [Candidatus Omnitrophota bacterium]